MRSATWLERGLFLGAALLLIDPRLLTDIAGLACLGAAFALQKLRREAPLAPGRET